jgi:hypothetical protein
VSPLFSRRQPSASPLALAALEQFAAALDAETRQLAERQAGTVDRGHRGRTAMVDITRGRAVLLPVDRSAPPFPMTRPASAASISLRGDDGAPSSSTSPSTTAS